MCQNTKKKKKKEKKGKLPRRSKATRRRTTNAKHRGWLSSIEGDPRSQYVCFAFGVTPGLLSTTDNHTKLQKKKMLIEVLRPIKHFLPISSNFFFSHRECRTVVIKVTEFQAFICIPWGIPFPQKGFLRRKQNKSHTSTGNPLRTFVAPILSPQLSPTQK